MHSIIGKIIILILSAMIAMAFPLTVMNLNNIEKFETSNATTTLNAKCRLKRNEIDKLLIRCEDFVNNGSAMMRSTFTYQDVTDQDIRHNKTQVLLKTMKNAVRRISDIETFYVHFNEDLIQGVDGFWYIKNHDDYVSKALTSATDYKENQTKWNAWYYTPIKAHKGVWVKPYYNANHAMNMISYCVPIYLDDKLVAVIGADLGFETLLAYFNNIQVYTTGKALLTDHQFKTLSESVTISSVTEIKNINLKKIMSKKSTNNDVLYCSFHAKKSAMAFTTLKNGLHVIFLVPVSEIFAKRDQAVIETLVIAIVLWLVFTIITLFFARKITVPLSKLTAVAKKIGEGDYNSQLPVTGDDEIATLTAALNTAVEAVHKNVDYVSLQAYQDELTKVKNYNAYRLKVRALNDEIQLDIASFAVVMIDMNKLKILNDEYGHEKGNFAIVMMAKTICDIFKHSPVYRVGGDEFVVILENEDLQNMESLLPKLDPFLMDRDMKSQTPWMQVAFSIGASRYLPHIDTSYNDVFARADAKMYACKKALHAERT